MIPVDQTREPLERNYSLRIYKSEDVDGTIQFFRVTLKTATNKITKKLTLYQKPKVPINESIITQIHVTHKENFTEINEIQYWRDSINQPDCAEGIAFVESS